MGISEPKVYLVGAGPGDPRLITLKGLECIRKADVIIYDYLISSKLLEEAPKEVEKIYVGKKEGKHTLEQEQINRLLVEKASEKKVVVRLKGGDPFLFGRGSEEALYLKERGIPFEVVPGVTSAIAAPAYAGIPVTHRGLASAVAFITGHEDPTKGESDVDWSKISTGVRTLVFLMGMKNLSQIVEKLTTSGRPEETPIALIRWGTWPNQQTLVGTLGDIVGKVAEHRFSPPAIIVVGDVVKLREDLNWFETKPLFGKRVLITRSRQQASEFAQILEGLGAEPVEFPTIRMVDPQDWSPLDTAIEQIETYHWIVFTSPNGVHGFVRRLFKNGKDIRDLKGVKLGAIGPATARAVQEYGLKVDYQPEKYVTESIVEGFRRSGDLKGTRVLLPRADKARSLLPEELEKMGAEVSSVIVYRTLVEDPPSRGVLDMLSHGEVDVVTFTSSSTVHNFVKIVGKDRLRDILESVEVASIGPITTETAEEMGIKVDITAEEHTVSGLAEAIVEHFEKGIVKFGMRNL